MVMSLIVLSSLRQSATRYIYDDDIALFLPTICQIHSIIPWIFMLHYLRKCRFAITFPAIFDALYPPIRVIFSVILNSQYQILMEYYTYISLNLHLFCTTFSLPYFNSYSYTITSKRKAGQPPLLKSK